MSSIKTRHSMRLRFLRTRQARRSLLAGSTSTADRLMVQSAFPKCLTDATKCFSCLPTRASTMLCRRRPQTRCRRRPNALAIFPRFWLLVPLIRFLILQRAWPKGAVFRANRSRAISFHQIAFHPLPRITCNTTFFQTNRVTLMARRITSRIAMASAIPSTT